MKVAIIGAGVTGSAAAAQLCSYPGIQVEIFDQGRRGAGGRTSHRLVRLEDCAVLPDDDVPETGEGLLAFDHGCQFFTANDARFRKIVDEWVAAGAACIWDGRFECIPGDARQEAGESTDAASDFFGLCGGGPLFTGNGGMHRIARHMVNQAVAKGAKFHRGVRVSGIRQTGAGTDRQWVLEGVGGEAAYHDTREEVAAAAEHSELCRADVLMVTDASCTFESWHRASAGVAAAAPQLAEAVRSRARVPLFTAMVAFEHEIELPALDAFVVEGSLGSPLWFAARTRSKPGLEKTSSCDCWTLVSTPGFAAEEIGSTEMQDPVTGAFRPQETGYLNGKDGPSETLLEAFHHVVRLKISQADRSSSAPGAVDGTMGDKVPSSECPDDIPQCVYLQGQRWGSAFPAPVSCCSVHDTPAASFIRDSGLSSPAAGTNDSSRKEIMGVLYETSTPPTAAAAAAAAAREHATKASTAQKAPLSPHPPDGDTGKGFFVDTTARLYYAGDFCSARLAGIEAAVLSGLTAVQHVAEGLSNHT